MEGALTEVAWIESLEQFAAQRGLPVDFVRAIVAVETGGNVLGEGDPEAVSDEGAVGLCQVEPETALDLLQKNPLLLQQILKMAIISLNLGTFDLKYRCEVAASSIGLSGMEAMKATAAAYNGGEGSVREAGRRFSEANGGKSPSTIEDIDPYLPQQARDYWRKVAKLFAG